MIVLILILLLIIAFLIIKVISYYYSVCGLLYYIEKNDIKKPTDKEINEAIKWAVEHSLADIIRKFKKIA